MSHALETAPDDVVRRLLRGAIDGATNVRRARAIVERYLRHAVDVLRQVDRVGDRSPSSRVASAAGFGPAVHNCPEPRRIGRETQALEPSSDPEEILGEVRAEQAPVILPMPLQIVEEGSTIGFAIRHYEINWVEGRFKDFTGSINYDEKDVTKSTVEFTAKIESVDTGVAPRDKHLRTADFFEVEKYPELTFKSTGVERKGKDKYVLNGDLTLKGVTKPVALPFTITGAITDPRGNTRFGIDAHTKINRRDFGINYGSALASGGFDVGNEVAINLQLEAVKPGPKPTASSK